MSLLKGRVALVTGASSGIGRAIALSLSREGATLCALGRNPETVAQTVAEAQRYAPAHGFPIDLAHDPNLQPLLRLLGDLDRLDIVVHCAGVIHENRMEEARIDHFDLQYATNVRAPYLLTQKLLPWLTVARGQIVFINSSVGLSVKRADVGQYSATKHALRAIADSLREEVNPRGIRVLSVYLGRTATPMQETLFSQQGKAYRPEMLMQPGDVAAVILNAVTLPGSVELTDISIRPLLKS
jgi:NAD(P)-dependent dehydrogenase (short-subunit alcohol dehydrogenase family)